MQTLQDPHWDAHESLNDTTNAQSAPRSRMAVVVASRALHGGGYNDEAVGTSGDLGVDSYGEADS